MGPLNYLLSNIGKKRRKKRLNLYLEQLKLKIEVKKIIECSYKGNCGEKDCPLIKIINEYDNNRIT
jgi:hypothetical protein